MAGFNCSMKWAQSTRKPVHGILFPMESNGFSDPPDSSPIEYGSPEHHEGPGESQAFSFP